MEQKALVSTIKTVVQIVKNLDESRRVYEQGFGLKCVAEIANADFYALKNIRAARFGREGEEFGMIDLIENPNATQSQRDVKRAFDFGLFTLNFRTGNIAEAIKILREYGAETVSEIQSYNVGKPMQEVMLNMPTGEKLTILQIGDTEPDAPVFREAIATVGFVVPSMQKALEFYRDCLGLNVAIAFQAKGSPFDTLLGVPALDNLDFATLTSDGNWTGKLELLELAVPNETPQHAKLDSTESGYLLASFETADFDKLLAEIEKSGAKIMATASPNVRVFAEDRRVILIRTEGGELLEFAEKS